MLEYLSSGKGTIPYELVTDFDFLSIVAEIEFFQTYQFYSRMKDSVSSDEGYENAKMFYTTLRLQNLGSLIKFITSKIQSYFPKYLKEDLPSFKKCLNLIQKNVTALVPLVAVLIETKVSLV